MMFLYACPYMLNTTTYIYICANIYWIYIYIYVIMFDHMSVFLYPYTIHKYICMDICMYVYIYACMYICHHISTWMTLSEN